jgi:hypothetical protein
LAAVASDIVSEIHEQSEGKRQASPAAHSEVKDVEAFGIAILVFRDPDNVQLELTAPR